MQDIEYSCVELTIESSSIVAVVDTSAVEFKKVKKSKRSDEERKKRRKEKKKRKERERDGVLCNPDSVSSNPFSLLPS